MPAAMARCSRCGTAWLARVAGADDYGSASGRFRRLPARARRPLIIEGEIAACRRAAAAGSRRAAA